MTIINPLVYQEGNTLLFRGGELLGPPLRHHARGDRGRGARRRARGGHHRGALAHVGGRGPGRAAAPLPPHLVSLRAHRLAGHAAGAGPGARRVADERGRALPAEPVGRLAVARSALAGALDRSVDLAAALELRGYALGGTPGAAPRAVVAPRPPARRGRRGHRAGGGGGTYRGGGRGGGLSAARASSWAPRSWRWPPRSCCWPRRRSPGARRGWGWPVPEPLVAAESFSYAYPEAREPALRDVTLALEPGTFTVLAGLSGSGKSTLLRALCGLVPHFHGGRVEGELTVAGMRVRDHGPGDLAAVCGTVLQEPEAQVVMGGVRAELELPLEHGGESAAVDRQGRGGDGARPGRGPPARPAHGHPLRRRAPARGHRRGDGAPPGAAPARRAHLPARPGGGRRARVAAAAAERGLGHRRGDGRAPAGALPPGRRPRGGAGGLARGLRRLAARLPRLGGRVRAGAGHPGGAALLARRAEPAARPRSARRARGCGSRRSRPPRRRLAAAAARRPEPALRVRDVVARARRRPHRAARHDARAAPRASAWP